MFHILVLCTHNSARSILAQVLLNHHGAPRITAHSAGSAPRPNQQPNALGLQVLREHGHNTQGLISQSWDHFALPSAPSIDLVITVCDSAAGEVCPLFMGTALKVHWGYADPSAGHGRDEQKLLAFRNTYAALDCRIQAFVAQTQHANTAHDLQAAALAVQRV